VNRLDLAGPYSMIEPLFVTATAGRITLSQRGQRHVGLVQEFTTRMQRMTASLGEDCARFRPVAGTYSPYGVMYGYSSNIVEHMAMKTLEADAESRFSLEDVFAGAGQGPQRLAWVSGWRRLPHVPQDVVKLYAYPQAFAEEIFSRIELALQKGASTAGSAQRTGRISIDAPGAPGLPAAWVKSSDPALIEAGQAQHCDEARLLADRQEGMHLVSFQTQAGWVAISKDLLTEAAGEGIDVNIQGLPESAIQTLEALYPRLVKR